MEVPWLDTLARGLCAKGGRRVAWERKSATAKSLNPPDDREIQGDLKTSAISEAENHKQAIAAEQASESQSLKGRFNQGGPDEADSPRLTPLTSSC